MPNRWNLVIFDNDGVLVDSEPIANRVLADLLSELGHPTTQAEAITNYLGGTIGRVRELVEVASGQRLPADFERRYEYGVLTGFETELRAIDHVGDALDAISAPVCVASSGSHARIQRTLTLTGLIGRFDGHLFSASDVERGKPAPDLFLHAAAAMGAAPERTAVIEDSPLGIAAASAAGMTPFGYSALTPGLQNAGAAACFDDMRLLPRLLDQLAPAAP